MGKGKHKAMNRYEKYDEHRPEKKRGMGRKGRKECLWKTKQDWIWSVFCREMSKHGTDYMHS